jgi:adenylate kinase family enzyme
MTDPRPTLRLIFFYGKGGAGKDTEADKLIALHPDWAVVSTGDQIKRARDPQSEFHSIIAPYEYLIDQGKNLPMEVVMNLQEPEKSIFPAFVASEMAKGTTTIISTGFPRTLEQHQALSKYVESLKQQGISIQEENIFIDVSDETSIYRITVIRPAEYEAMGRPKRSDDNPVAAATRLEVFRHDTLPVVNELRAAGRIVELSGEGTKDQTHTLVEEALMPKPALEISRPQRERR